ncbi:MAG: HD domain-containing phosphohydrolase [Gallionellaceae bacterium]
MTLNLKHTLVSSLKTPGLVDIQTRIKNFAAKIQALCEEDIDAALASPYLDVSNPYIVVHQIMGAILTEIIAERNGLSAAERLPFICAALTRDIGQLQIQSDLDKCNGPLPPALKLAMQGHPSRSEEVLSGAGVTDTRWLSAVQMHHERSDGSGYPLGVADENIALGAQILAIADTYSAMTKVRPYRTKAHNPTDALRNLYKAAGQGSALVETLIKGIGMMPPGSIVKLKNGEIAVVKSCILKANDAVVFSVYDTQGMPLFSPVRRKTKLPDFEIVGLMSLAECKSVAVMIRRLWIK